MTKMCMQCGYKFDMDFDECPLCGVNFDEIIPEKVGLFGDKGKQKEIQQRYEQKFNISIEELENNFKIKNFLEEYNIKREGIWFHVIFPEEEIVLKRHSAFTKGIATLSLGLVGLAATSGIDQDIMQKEAYCIVKVVEAGIILKVTKDYVFDDTIVKEVRIPFEEIKCIREVSQKFRGEFELVLLGNEVLTFYYSGFPINHKERKNYQVELNALYDEILEIINNGAKGNENPEEQKWDSIIYEKNEINGSNNSSSIGELEKIINMHEKGLISEEEFNILKQKLIGVPKVSLNKFCGNCGAEISNDSKFCSECGTKLNR